MNVNACLVYLNLRRELYAEDHFRISIVFV